MELTNDLIYKVTNNIPLKRYFVVSDIHSFFNQFFVAITDLGFDINNSSDYLIICGDLFDRGPDSKKLLDYLLSIPEERLILIRGNHEDLIYDCLEDLKHYHISTHHISNGTIDTISQLTDINKYDILIGNYKYTTLRRRLSKCLKLIDRAKDYYELDNYIFVHGWIPHVRNYDNLHKCKKAAWKYARWYNGMEDWHNGWKLEDYIIVCGHWNTSFGNFKYHHEGSGQFENDSNFGIFEDDGIIALDGCTVLSKKVNVKVIEKFGNKVELNKTLINLYPWLKPKNRFTGEVLDDYDYSYTELDNLPNGWLRAFGLQLVEELDKALGDFREEYRIIEIKEKYGMLCWYDSGHTDEAEEVIDKYQQLSAKTCIECGKPATQLSVGWICPYCDECADKTTYTKFMPIESLESKNL